MGKLSLRQAIFDIDFGDFTQTLTEKICEPFFLQRIFHIQTSLISYNLNGDFL